jgi:hypothetical protein
MWQTIRQWFRRWQHIRKLQQVPRVYLRLARYTHYAGSGDTVQYLKTNLYLPNDLRFLDHESGLQFPDTTLFTFLENLCTAPYVVLRIGDFALYYVWINRRWREISADEAYRLWQEFYKK